MPRHLALVLVLGCSEPPMELGPTELAEICGEAAPVKLRGMAENEWISIPVPAGDRIVVGVGEYADDTPIGGHLVSIAECGGDERIIYDASAYPYPPIRPDAPWLAIDDDEIHWVDPMGRRAPQLVARGQVVAEHDGQRYIAVAQDEGELFDLMRLVIHGDVFELEPVLADVMFAPDLWNRARPGTTLVLDGDARLVEVDLATGALEVLATGVADFCTTHESRFVAYRAQRDYESDSLFQPWYLLDRETGVRLFATNAEIVACDDAALRANDESHTLLWLLPGLDAHRLQGGWQAATYVDDGRVIVWRVSPDELWIFDRRDAPPRLLFRGGASHSHTEGDAIVLVTEPPPRLVRVPLDGSAPGTIASGVYAPQPLGDGRFAMLRDLPGDHHELVVVGEGPVTLIDDEVDGNLGLMNAYRLDATQPLFYVLGLTALDRAGLYRVHVAPDARLRAR